MTKKALWVPTDAQATKMDRFRCHVNAKRGLDLRTYHDLHGWSTNPSTLGQFWNDALEFLDIASPSPSASALRRKPKTMFPPSEFFPDLTFNLAEFLLRRSTIPQYADQIAVIGIREQPNTVEKVTWISLRERVRRVFDAMSKYDIQKGDRVAAIIGNTVEAMVICLATLALGAVYSSTSPDMGAEAIMHRFGQIRPKLVITETGYTYAGKNICLAERINTWSCQLLSNVSGSRIVLLPHENNYPRITAETSTWEDFVELGSGLPLQFQPLSFSSPAFILFTSGTTGLPKCIIHSAGAAALKILVDQQFHNDVRESDVVLQFTTTAWVMWVFNFVLLGTGAVIIAYDGSPFHPNVTRLLKIIEDYRVTVFGTSPRYLSELQSRRIAPRESFSITSLRTVTSTGSILTPSQYEWFYKVAFPPSTHLISMCGGTDLLGCFVGGVPILPLYSGEIQGKALGMAVDVLNATPMGPVSLEDGRQGELVCRQPFPSQPLGFFGSDGMKLYRKAYFEGFGDSIWQQGDLVQVLPDTKGIIVYGRSDGVLNPSGIRFGPSEIYTAIETIPGIVDYVCVGRQLLGDLDEKVILFVKLSPIVSLDERLISSIRTSISQKLSRRHVPHNIFEVDDIPYTVNGKRCEIHVKCIINGRKLPAVVTVSNPGCLKEYEAIHQRLLRRDGKKHGSARL